tara:strand:- start:2005 stop:2676 length:672 start_codon:yes stop_codon:yes gene_type:complete
VLIPHHVQDARRASWNPTGREGKVNTLRNEEPAERSVVEIVYTGREPNSFPFRKVLFGQRSGHLKEPAEVHGDPPSSHSRDVPGCSSFETQGFHESIHPPTCITGEELIDQLPHCVDPLAQGRGIRLGGSLVRPNGGAWDAVFKELSHARLQAHPSLVREKMRVLVRQQSQDVRGIYDLRTASDLDTKTSSLPHKECEITANVVSKQDVATIKHRIQQCQTLG